MFSGTTAISSSSIVGRFVLKMTRWSSRPVDLRSPRTPHPGTQTCFGLPRAGRHSSPRSVLALSERQRSSTGAPPVAFLGVASLEGAGATVAPGRSLPAGNQGQVGSGRMAVSHRGYPYGLSASGTPMARSRTVSRAAWLVQVSALVWR